MQYPGDAVTGQAVATAAGTIVPHQMAPPPGEARRRMSGTKRARSGHKSTMAVSEDEDDTDKRRQGRNLREQQRSQKITEQIEQLRSILSSAQIRHKPDKFSTLVTVGDYIQQLQERSAVLDAEHQKLIDTISRTNEMANEPHLPGSASSRSSNATHEATDSNSGISDIYNEEELVFVRNVDYKNIFNRCGIPLAVASIDGRFLDCNVEFEDLSGYKREEMLPPVPAESQPDPVPSIPSDAAGQSLSELGDELQSESGRLSDMTPEAAQSGNADVATSTKSLSLFNLLSRECMEHVFLALSTMLKRPSIDAPELKTEAERKDYWTGNVRLNRNVEIEMRMSIVLVRSPEGRAKFFNCYLSPLFQVSG
ncbi:MAG: hypothetical protein SGILL_000727 [Bacillariaceae sp.]